MALISSHGRPQTTWIIALSLAAGVGAGVMQWWWVLGGVVFVAVVLLAFFRDPERVVPTGRGLVVSSADGRVTSVHTLERYEPLGGPAVCIRVFLSVLDVHVNRSPMHGRVRSITPKAGEFLSALKAESAERNESVTVVLEHPIRGDAVCAVRQVAGAVARRIVCGATVGQVLQRGERFGLIKFGSTTEVYLPHPERVTVKVGKGLYVWGGVTVLAEVSPATGAEGRDHQEVESSRIG